MSDPDPRSTRTASVDVRFEWCELPGALHFLFSGEHIVDHVGDGELATGVPVETNSAGWAASTSRLTWLMKRRLAST